MNTRNEPHLREGRGHASRLTVELTQETMTALKIHAAIRQKTIREIVTDLVRKEVEERAA